MPRRPRHDDPDDGSDEYDAYRDYDPDDADMYPEGLYTDDDLPTVPCPQCREDILEDAERCPHCGYYPSREDAPPGRKSSAWVVLMVLALLAAVMLMMSG
jgi:hypothetical protein